METLVILGGGYCIALALFHLSFWGLFGWRRGLRPLSAVNRGAMQVMNISLIIVFLMFAYLSLFHTGELLSTALGGGLLLTISLLWLLRAVLQVIFFGLAHWASRSLFVVFLAGSGLYGVPVLYRATVGS